MSKKFISLPMFTEGGGRLWRQCTKEWKIEPIHGKIRELLGLKKGERARKEPQVEHWFGISLDEADRMRDSDHTWIHHRYPLVFDVPMTRQGCLKWLRDRGYPEPARSACIGCLAAETEVITSNGVRSIASLAGRTTELLIPKRRGAWSEFKPVEVRSFGVQQLWKIVLSKHRSRIRKIVFATAEHRWKCLTTSGWSPFRTTVELSVGDAIPESRYLSILASRHSVAPSPFGIAAGFTYGDGSRVNGRKRSPAFVDLFEGKDEPLIPYFSQCPCTKYPPRLNANKGWTRVYGLPRGWKDKPSLNEARGYLLGWLAGYFAADGHVTQAGQAELYSHDIGDMRFVRDLCCLLGVGTAPIRSKRHPGKTGPAVLHSVCLNVRHLPSAFWLMPHHSRRVRSKVQEHASFSAKWIVKSVEVTDRVEEVFCAVVPGRELFVLADGVVTGNCPFHSNADWRAMKRDRPEEFREAVEFERRIQATIGSAGDEREILVGTIKIKRRPYLHRSLRPLDQVDLSSAEDRGQLNWIEECTGLCGN